MNAPDFPEHHDQEEEYYDYEQPENVGRLCIKNLPTKYTSDKLRELMSEQGIVTDAKVMRTNRGKSRKFGFVGFRTPEMAAKARDFFNRSYVETSQVFVDFAAPSGHQSLTRPWSKYSVGSSRHLDRFPMAREQKTENVRNEMKNLTENGELTDAQKSKLENDPRFKDFLAIMKPRINQKVWANDDDGMDSTMLNQQAKKKKKKKKKKSSKGDDSDSSSSDDEDYDVNKNIVVVDAKSGADEKPKQDSSADLAFLTSKKTSGFAFDSSDDEDAAPVKRAGGDIDSSDEDNDDDVINMDQLLARGSKKNEAADAMKDEHNDAMIDEAVTANDKAKSEWAKEGDDAVDLKALDAKPKAELSARLFVRNLPFSMSSDELETLFQKYGELSEVHVPLDEANRCKGFAFVTFVFAEHAARAYVDLDGSSFQGRLLHILPAEAKPVPKEELVNQSKTYKAEKERKRKANSNNSDSWNTLFIASDTVASAIASKYGMKKGDVLDKDSKTPMAVRLALAETQLLTEAKQFLEGEGVNMQSFSENKAVTKRSKTVIIVKNIPFETEVQDLRKLFGKFGTLGRLVIPPTKTIALVEYVESNEAKAGFRGLAYKKFKHVPLYLEWAPLDVFSSPASASSSTSSVPGKVAPVKGEVAQALAPQRESSGDSNVLFVKNLNFDTTEGKLHRTFGKLGNIRSVTIAKKANRKRKSAEDPHMLSMGYGFVEFDSSKVVVKAIKKLQHVEVDGHKLELSHSAPEARKSSSSSHRHATSLTAADKLSKTKIVVRNVPFEATSSELRDLIGTYGKIQSLRIPRKFDGTHRGFAFVDFVTQAECKSASEAISATHFYGRHLVVEPAKEEESLEDMQDRVTDQFEADMAAEKRGIVKDRHKKHKKRRTE